MAIDSLRDGFVRLCFDPSANILGEKCRMVLEGQYLSTGTDPAIADELVKVTSVNDISANFGAGSVLAESLRVAITCCGNEAVEIFALPREDADGATAAVYTLTITNTAGSDGRIDIYWGNSIWNISVRVEAGDTPTIIAAAIVAEIDPTFPYTAVAALGVITFTAKNAGTVGNFLVPSINWHGRNAYLPQDVTFVFDQTTPGAGDPEPLDYSAVLGECCVCCYSILTGNADWQQGVIDYLEDAWSCEKPQCFGHGYTYNAGSLGQILATDTNSAVISRLAHCNSDGNFPWLKVAAFAAKSCCLTVDNPEISIQGPNFGVLDCIRRPESCSECWTFAERGQLDDSGFVVTVSATGGRGALTSPMVVNDVTNNRFDEEGRQNLTFRNASSRRLASSTAALLSEQLQQFNGLGYFTENTNIREGAQGTNKKMMLGIMRAWVRDQVGTLFSQFDDLNKDLTFSDDFQMAPRCQGVPGKIYMNLTYRPPVRIQNIVVNAAPRLMNNC